MVKLFPDTQYRYSIFIQFLSNYLHFIIEVTSLSVLFLYVFIYFYILGEYSSILRTFLQDDVRVEFGFVFGTANNSQWMIPNIEIARSIVCGESRTLEIVRTLYYINIDIKRYN